MPQPTEDFWIDANGVPTERTWRGGQEVIVHYDDVPDQDLTVLDGIPVTTALRTVIDIAPEVGMVRLRCMVDDCLRRRLFTVEEALARTAEEDIRNRRGAIMVRQVLER